MKPSDFVKDPDISQFAADLMRMKDGQKGGRKERRIESERRVADGRMVEIRGKNTNTIG